MTIKKPCVFTSVALMAMGACSVAGAQTCSAPQTITSNFSGTFNNCAAGSGGNGDTSVGTVCDSSDVTGGVHVFTWTKGAAGTASGSLTVVPTAPYNAAVFVGDGADCATASGGFCDGKTDGAAQATETVDLSTLNAAKTYFLFVASTAAGTGRCGQYNLTVGTLPVKLQSFDVN